MRGIFNPKTRREKKGKEEGSRPHDRLPMAKGRKQRQRDA